MTKSLSECREIGIKHISLPLLTKPWHRLDEMSVVLESLGLAYMDVNTRNSLKPLSPYIRLRNLGHKLESHLCLTMRPFQDLCKVGSKLESSRQKVLPPNFEVRGFEAHRKLANCSQV